MNVSDVQTAYDLLGKFLKAQAWPRTDRAVVGPPPSLPIAPVMTDPIFGSTIYRITENDGRSYRTQSSGNSWSADSKQFTVTSTAGAIYLFAWDGKIAVNAGPLSAFATDVCFDRTVPGVIYGGAYRNDEAIIRRSSAEGVADVLGVRSLVPNVDAAGRTYLRGLSVSAGRMAFIFGGQAQDLDRYAYICNLDGTQGHLLDSSVRLTCLLHACALDLSGRYLILGPTAEAIAKGAPTNYVWDTVADTLMPMPHSGGHGAIGIGISVNNPDDADGMQYFDRALAHPEKLTELITPYPTPPAFQMASHLSWCGTRNAVISATYRYASGVNAPWREWDDEIIEVSVAGGADVKRFCHHRSSVSNGDDFQYWATPKPAVSPDGSAVLFTSNWGRTLGTDPEGPRQDVFLVRVA